MSVLFDLSIALCAALLTVWALQRWIIFARPVAIRHIQLGPHTDFSVRDLRLTRPDGAVLVGWVSTPIATPPTNKVLIYFGGRREHVSWAPYMASHLPGWTVYTFAYRGFAGSTGTPSESRIKRDAQAVFHHVRTLHGNRIQRLAIAGRSLGGCPAMWLSRDVKPDDLILLSPFESMSSVLLNLPFGRLIAPLLCDRLTPAVNRGLIASRTLLLLAESDALVPHHLSRRVSDFLSSPPQIEVIPDTDHKTLPRHHLTQQLIAEHLSKQLRT